MVSHQVATRATRGTGEVAGVVHGQEYVVNAAATSKNRAALETMNAGGTVNTDGNNSGTMNVIVNLNEDSTKAGTTETSSMNGKQVIDVFVSNIRSGGAAASALESTYKVKRAGAF